MSAAPLAMARSRPDWRAELAALQGAYASGTLALLGYDFDRYEAWCAARAVSALPTSSQDLAEYVTELVPMLSRRTIGKRVWAVRRIHKLCGFGDPARSRLVELAIRRSARLSRTGREPARPLRFAEMEQLVAAAPRTVRGLRDRLMIRLAYDTLCRGAELAELRVEDVTYNADGTARIWVGHAKNDPLRQGDYAYVSRETVEVLREWLQASRISEGYILRMLRGPHVTRYKVGRCMIGRQLRVLAAAAGWTDVKGLMGHSTRAGAAQDLVLAGCSLLEVMRAGRWRDARMVAHYVQTAPVNVWAVVERTPETTKPGYRRRPVQRRSRS